MTKIKLKNIPTVFALTESLNMNLDNEPPGVRLLSPFDNSVIFRDRASQFFHFDYRIECYTPKAKRKYGYFCLPILFQNELVGRVDCKAHRKEKQFEMISFYLESKTIDQDEFIEAFSEAAKSFAAYNKCETVAITKTKPRSLRQKLQRLMPLETS